ncbi:MAG: sugar transferase [Pseudomonadota bacterium]
MKNCFDIVLSCILLIVLSPIFLLISILVRIKLGPPIIFQQERPGYLGHPFIIYKFRSMMDKKNNNGILLSDSERLTRFGRLLRKSSLDELPELFNVLKGEMSLVGPRPLLMQYLERYSHEQARRHDVKPGITGWAQINGRNAVTWEEKFKMDVWYVDNHTLWLDVKILFQTIVQVLKSDGIHQKGHATAQEFMGSKDDE